jgi:hypothetical protein
MLMRSNLREKWVEMEQFFDGRNQIQIKNRWKKMIQCNHLHSESFQSVSVQADLYFRPHMLIEFSPQVCLQKVQQEPYTNMMFHQCLSFQYLEEPNPPLNNHLIPQVQIEAKQNHRIRLQPISPFLKENEFNLQDMNHKFQTIQIDVI